MRKVFFVEGEYYHIYNRGNSKQLIFRDSLDYTRFLEILFACNSTENFNKFSLGIKTSVYDYERGDQLVAIGAYCLMPNHFHILITQTQENGISRFMQKLSTAYSMYFNNKYERTGSLFEGKFKSEYLNTDIYLKYIFSYIHLNPLKLIDKNWKESVVNDKTKFLSYLDDYFYSSYSDYTGRRRKENLILDRDRFPDYFPNTQLFTKEIFDWLSFND